MERLIDPVIADMQCEHDHATRSGQPSDRWRLLFNGYLAFWKVLALHVPIAWMGRIIRAFAGRSALGRALGAGTITILTLTALLIAPPLRGLLSHDGQLVSLAFLLLPQAIPLSLPLSLLVGVLCGFRGRTVTNSVRAAVLCNPGSPAR